MDNKAQVNQSLLIGVIGTVVLLIAIGIIFATSFKSMSTIEKMAENDIANVRNESVAWINGTSVSLRQSNLVDGSEKVWNLTGGAACCYQLKKNSTNSLTGNNYSINYEGGTLRINNQSTGVWNTTMNISYSYYIGSQERNISLQSKEGVKVLSDFQPTWALIIAVGILITALLVPLIIFVYNKFS